MENVIMLRRQSKRRPQFWFKAIFSLGLWLLWWRNNYLALSEQAIIRRRGVFTKEERAVPLNRVQDISISYGIVRRILGHGDIRIETAGTAGTEIVMKNIDKPEEFREKVFARIDEFYGEEEPAEPEKPKKAETEVEAEPEESAE
ncbi:MAG: PH domain-containing protein [Anaerolineae bacterium]|jgi:putative membrane protein|nr:PH domain-containing protein [Anaerolineae bacterium]